MSKAPAPRRACARAQALFERHYEGRARFVADEEPKRAASGARRAATALAIAETEFDAILDAKQTLRAAVGIMRSLGEDLDGACALARQRKLANDREALAERQAAADRVAVARWAEDDATMLAEAEALADFIDHGDALDVQQWIRERHVSVDCACFPDEVAGRERLAGVFVDHGKGRASALDVRRRAAEYIQALSSLRTPRQHKDMWYVGLDDFEAWRDWRRAIADAITPPRIGRST
jgi:hypothetical protein